MRSRSREQHSTDCSHLFWKGVHRPPPTNGGTRGRYATPFQLATAACDAKTRVPVPGNPPRGISGTSSAAARGRDDTVYAWQIQYDFPLLDSAETRSLPYISDLGALEPDLCVRVMASVVTLSFQVRRLVLEPLSDDDMAATLYLGRLGSFF